MQASNFFTTALIWTLEGLVESREGVHAAVKLFSIELAMTDTDALCSLAVIKGD